MSQSKKTFGIVDYLIAIAVTIVIAVLVGICFDYYYEFNDDVLMKDILSGVYTGRPEALNIQMQAPVSALIALFYKVVPAAPWYGLFLCGCHYLCLFLLSYRAVTLVHNIINKIVVAVIVGTFFVALCLPHLVMAQYTITVAIMAATAAFWFYTIAESVTGKAFLKQAAVPLVLLFLAYLIRSEMLLLMLPYVAITGLVRWNKEKQMFTKDIASGYLIVGGLILLSIGAGFVSNKCAYSSPEWKEFIRLFDNRTQLYDYQYIPDYEEHEEFYDSIGLSQAKQHLLVNYDYAISDEIDADVLGTVAEYAAKQRDEEFVPHLKITVKEYIYRIVHFSDGAYSVAVAFLYIMVILAIIARKESTIRHKAKIIVLRIGGMIVMRSVPWMYIVWGRRAPDRIVHSLYIIEITILAGFLIVEGISKLRDREFLMMIASVMLLVGSVVVIPMTARNLRTHIEKQDQINQYAQAIDEYCASHPENFYFEDVYSTIRDGESFNQKMFVNVDNTITNYDLIGGWAAGSPLYYKKLSRYGIENIGNDIIAKENVYIICDYEYGMDWVSDYYSDRGINVVINQVDEISRIFGVYQVVDN